MNTVSIAPKSSPPLSEYVYFEGYLYVFIAKNHPSTYIFVLFALKKSPKFLFNNFICPGSWPPHSSRHSPRRYLSFGLRIKLFLEDLGSIFGGLLCLLRYPWYHLCYIIFGGCGVFYRMFIGTYFVGFGSQVYVKIRILFRQLGLFFICHVEIK